MFDFSLQFFPPSPFSPRSSKSPNLCLKGTNGRTVGLKRSRMWERPKKAQNAFFPSLTFSSFHVRQQQSLLTFLNEFKDPPLLEGLQCSRKVRLADALPSTTFVAYFSLPHFCAKISFSLRYLWIPKQDRSRKKEKGRREYSPAWYIVVSCLFLDWKVFTIRSTLRTKIIIFFLSFLGQFVSFRCYKLVRQSKKKPDVWCF